MSATSVAEHHILHVMVDLCHRLADVGKPLTLTQREKCVPLQRIQCKPAAVNSSEHVTASGIGFATDGSSPKLLTVSIRAVSGAA